MLAVVLLPLLLQVVSTGAPVSVTLPSGTPIWVKSDKTVPLHVGQAVPAHLMYGVYAENRLVLPAGTPVQGTVVGLQAERSHRLQSRLRGDFTPFSKPVVQFDHVLVGGHPLRLPVSQALDGAPVLQLTPPPPRKGGLIRHEYEQGKGMVRDRVRLVTAPGKKDRLRNLLYSQLPYHPQNIPQDTVWTADTTEMLALAPAPDAPASATPPTAATKPVADTAAPETWILKAYFSQAASSADAKIGEPLEAVVTEPVLDDKGGVAVPQGAVLQGEITRARPARRFGRAGELRFDFHQLTFPGQIERQEVQTNLAGIDAVGDSNLTLNREGEVQRKPQDKLVVPFLLLTLAGRPLDRDGNHEGAFGKDAVASNSLGVVGFILGTAGGWRNVAAGIGYYGSAIAIWNRWIKRGQETTLRRDTRLVVQTTVRRSVPLRVPQAAQGNGHTR